MDLTREVTYRGFHLNNVEWDDRDPRHGGLHHQQRRVRIGASVRAMTRSGPWTRAAMRPTCASTSASSRWRAPCMGASRQEAFRPVLRVRGGHVTECGLSRRPAHRGYQPAGLLPCPPTSDAFSTHLHQDRRADGPAHGHPQRALCPHRAMATSPTLRRASRATATRWPSRGPRSWRPRTRASSTSMADQSHDGRCAHGAWRWLQATDSGKVRNRGSVPAVIEVLPEDSAPHQRPTAPGKLHLFIDDAWGIDLKLPVRASAENDPALLDRPEGGGVGLPPTAAEVAHGPDYPHGGHVHQHLTVRSRPWLRLETDPGRHQDPARGVRVRLQGHVGLMTASGGSSCTA